MYMYNCVPVHMWIFRVTKFVGNVIFCYTTFPDNYNVLSQSVCAWSAIYYNKQLVVIGILYMHTKFEL